VGDQPQLLAELVDHLRAEADFNRSWTDGRRRGELDISPDYRARRLEVAAQRDSWADEVELLAALAKATTPGGAP
jgi:hypothetical protein